MVQTADDTRRRPGGGAGGRVPPHNLEAEESLLGAMLLSRDAIVVAVEARLAATDFYKPAHGHVFEAITSLYEQGEPADPVTVAEELRRAGVLEGIGGPATLISLQARTPAIGNATRYASIVEEHSLLRRLIAVASQIAEMGYSVPDDVLAAIDEAEALVFEVAQRRVTDSMLPIRELLERHLDHIEALYERGQDIIGVPTGYLDLDHQLAGLQPSNLVIVGGRPGTGKALSLDTPIATPTGWTTMGELEVGDQVFDEQGRPCPVTFATPVMGGRPCYEVSFDDGSTLVADADHQWLAKAADGEGRGRVVTTQQMVDEGVRVGRGQRPNWHIPLTQPLDPPEVEMAADPYLVGRWVANATAVGSPATGGEGQGSHFSEAFAAAGDVFEGKERIPVVCLRGSAKQRLALLQGLLDTAGHVAATGSVELCLGERALLEQAREVACSLGHKPGPVGERWVRGADGRPLMAWWMRWVPLDPVFRVREKAERLEAVCSRPKPGDTTCRAVTAIRPVASVPVRCITVDSPSHLYLAGHSMIPTHNTSFALGIAAHAALDGRHPVLVFSLEMSHLELTQRLLCAEARVDATRMRNGKLLETDWPKISHAVGRLAESPIHIDDNPRLTIMEIRAKARRLKSRNGLGLIIVDYLQLMTGRTSAENRQVEVSEISRGLKILARELEVPVIALSQLSRNLETRADKRPILADLRESGCLTADTRVLRADTGAEVTMGELFVEGERDIPVWSLDEHLKMTRATMERVFWTGVKPVFSLRLTSGREVKASANHPFLTLDGWARLDELKVGDGIAVPRCVPEPSESHSWPDAEVVMLAHLIGDGCVGARQPGNRSCEKFIPSKVFSLPDEQVALFLRHLGATDGSTGFFAQQGPIYYASSSRQLVDDIRLLLQRLHVQASIGQVTKDDHRSTYHLQLIGAEDERKFLCRIGVHGQRGERAGALSARLKGISRHACSDSIPIGVWEMVRPKASALGYSEGRLAASTGGGRALYGCAPTRVRLGAVATTLEDSNIHRIATSDVLWDTIVGIEPVGEAPVFDATVSSTHNFIANGIVVENSLEQDADVVIFLYRDELYNRDSPDRGTAEVIVAKHRNGPVGITQLAFLENYTRFANMARGV